VAIDSASQKLSRKIPIENENAVILIWIKDAGAPSVAALIEIEALAISIYDDMAAGRGRS
jgi:hypothetical protein